MAPTKMSFTAAINAVNEDGKIVIEVQEVTCFVDHDAMDSIQFPPPGTLKKRLEDQGVEIPIVYRSLPPKDFTGTQRKP